MVFNWILEKIAWSYNERQLAKYAPTISKINELYEEYNKFTDEDIKNKSIEFRERLEKWETIDDILSEALAVHKQACKRLVWKEYKVKWETEIWNMIPYDVQLLGWMILNEGKIAEMKTWEGKTLVSTIAAYLNALTWKWVHLVTVNDYLAERDAQIMMPLYEFLWISVWVVSKNVPIEKRRWEYEKDITYVENAELWFDYLRDNLAQSMEQRILLFRDLNYAIVDEADSIMIDEARTPLIISQPSAEPTEKYVQYANIVKALEACPFETEKKKSWLFDDWEKKELNCDYKIDPKAKTALLTSKWIAKLEKLLWVENLYRDLGYEEIHHMENALKAKACYIKDKYYLVHNGEVLIIDENTGRAMPGRRYSEWLHQAIEAKEWVQIQKESETVATITYQNFLKLYKKLAWMTGTAATEWEEFEKIYNLEVLVIPTNKPIIRVDKHDKVFFDQEIKFNNVVNTVKFYHKMGVPFLLWTSSVQTSEILSNFLRKEWLQHSVLNAKYHEMEAKIISNAGKKWSIIVATNMAWRWTDIKLEKWLFDIISENYTKWINEEIKKDKWISWVIYSEFETNKILEKLINSLSDDNIIFYSKQDWQKQLNKKDILEKLADLVENKIDFTLEWNFYLEVKFNKSKKNKEQALTQIIVKKDKNAELELIEKDLHMWLYVLASEKHESRRIDNQLRGRSWRQWDPGITQFYVALDDDLMIKSGGLVTKTLAGKLYSREDLEQMAIENRMIANSIERAQKQMEAMSFSMRKNLFEYDSVLNEQRNVIYGLRDKLLKKENLDNILSTYVEDIITKAVNIYSYDKDSLVNYLEEITWINFKEEIEKYRGKDLKDYLILKLNELIENKRAKIWEEQFEDIKRRVILSVLDRLWMKHIDEIMYLRDKVSMYGYAQIDPLLQYKKEAFEKYQSLISNLRTEIISTIIKLDVEQFTPQTQIIEIWGDASTENLINKLKQAWNLAKDMEVSKPIEAKQTWPKVLESNDEFEVIELDDDTKAKNDKEAEELINKMLGK
jgi:preprotein translocase subunit SecA